MNGEDLLKHRDELVGEVLAAQKGQREPGPELRKKASKAATLEGLIARKLLLAGDNRLAVESFGSQAACLSFARRPREAFRIYDKARVLAASHRMKKHLLKKQQQLPGPPPCPQSVFQSAKTSIKSNTLLRRPQKEAYSATLKHFAERSDHALIQLPVGCGKTGTMCLLPFGIARGRVLVVARPGDWSLLTSASYIRAALSDMVLMTLSICDQAIGLAKALLSLWSATGISSRPRFIA
jgi:hypothetical protein